MPTIPSTTMWSTISTPGRLVKFSTLLVFVSFPPNKSLFPDCPLPLGHPADPDPRPPLAPLPVLLEFGDAPLRSVADGSTRKWTTLVDTLRPVPHLGKASIRLDWECLHRQNDLLRVVSVGLLSPGLL